jgi:hypothetical protein
MNAVYTSLCVIVIILLFPTHLLCDDPCYIELYPDNDCIYNGRNYCGPPSPETVFGFKNCYCPFDSLIPEYDKIDFKKDVRLILYDGLMNANIRGHNYLPISSGVRLKAEYSFPECPDFVLLKYSDYDVNITG